MLQSFENRPEHVTALDRVRAWTRERFTLAGDAADPRLRGVLRAAGLSAARDRGRVLDRDDRRHQFKLFKPVAEVVVRTTFHRPG